MKNILPRKMDDSNATDRPTLKQRFDHGNTATWVSISFGAAVKTKPGRMGRHKLEIRLQ